MSAPRKRVAVLISGRGSNMSTLIAAAAESDYPAEIVGVISDNPEARGLGIAAGHGIPTKALPRKDFASKEAHDAAIGAALTGFGAEIVALAGYMRLLTPGFTRTWEGRMINIHPALLPSFKGLDTHRRALDAGVRIHGCTVHFVNDGMDEGAIIAQAAVPVLTDDTEDTLTARVLKAEHKLYPLALRLVAEGGIRLEGGRTVYRDVVESDTLPTILAPDPLRQIMDLEGLARITP